MRKRIVRSDEPVHAPSRVCVLSAALPSVGNSVGDFGWLLAHHLSERRPVTMLLPFERGRRPSAFDRSLLGTSDRLRVVPIPAGWTLDTSRAILDAVRAARPSAVLVHFVPQLYGWKGAKPLLAWTLTRLWREGIPVVTVAHEFHAPFGPSPKVAALSALQRGILQVLMRTSARVIVTTAFVQQMFGRRFPSRSRNVRQIPIGNPLAVASLDPARKADLRRRLGIDPDVLVVSSFGSDLPSTDRLLRATLAAVVRQVPSSRVLLLGRRSEALGRLLESERTLGDRLVVAGPLGDQALSEHLSLSDIFVALFPDGASTRRTSLMMGLAHEVAVVSNDGPLTDHELRGSNAICLIGAGQEPATNELLRRLMSDPVARHELADRGGAFYRDRFSWDRIAAKYDAVLEEVTPS